MERKNRLNHSVDIQRVRRHGKSIAHPFFVLIYTRDKSLDTSPVGVIASKAVGGAVERNRAKRVLRSAAAELQGNIQPGCMILLIARQAILEHDTPEITQILTEQLKKAEIFSDNAQE
ncbi:MAG: ribonuclease P protein component [Anaerolineaceae bacterium]|nr:ribonuclease P protein component [Anaerolineaceae bacterium]